MAFASELFQRFLNFVVVVVVVVVVGSGMFLVLID